jgi:hypothetical protein
MKRFWRVLAKPVTAPVRAAKDVARLARIGLRARAVLHIAEEAEADPRLYRDAAWQSRLLTAAGELFVVLPIASEVRMKIRQYVLPAAMVLGSIGGLAGYLADKGVLELLPEKYAGTIGVVCGACGTVAAWLMKSPLVALPREDAGK